MVSNPTKEKIINRGPFFPSKLSRGLAFGARLARARDYRRKTSP